MAKETKLKPLQFNLLAIVLLLVAAPFAIAFITNAGSSTDGTFQSSMTMESDPATFDRGLWYDNGGNYTEYYEQNIAAPQGWYNCAYISNGQCGDDYSYSTDTYLPITSTMSSWHMPSPSIAVKQTHQHVLAPGEYLGTSGHGPFAWYLYGSNFDGIEGNDSLDKVRYTFIDYATEYSCLYSGFTNLTIEASISFYYGGNVKKFEGFVFEGMNKYEYNRYDNQIGQWDNACVVGMTLEFDFTGFESLSLTSFNGGNWSGTDHLIELHNVERDDGENIGSTPLPWAGDGMFWMTAEHQSINTITAGFIIKSSTLVLSVVTFALGIASTPYWDPFANFFKGAI